MWERVNPWLCHINKCDGTTAAFKKASEHYKIVEGSKKGKQVQAMTIVAE